MNPRELRKYGQSIWLDYIRRHLLTSQAFEHMVREDGVSGVTSNPSIFERAVAGSTDYDAVIARDSRKSAEAIYERLAVEDIRGAADVLLPVYQSSACGDGYACIEVSPHLAYDTEASILEARRLWREVNRPNIMVKVPGTEAGLPAIRQLVSEGININITLLFSRRVCREVAEAYMSGLEELASKGGDLKRVASVASMFVSRIDVAVARLVQERMAHEPSAPADSFSSVMGKVGIANAKLAYQDWRDLVSTPRWQRLAERGARRQRLLWASTGTKDPHLSDVLYVESLIGPDTVNTVPPATLDAFRDHGTARPSLLEGLDEAHHTLSQLEQLDLSLDDITERLVHEGVDQFASAFTQLMSTIEEKRRRAETPRELA